LKVESLTFPVKSVLFGAGMRCVTDTLSYYL